MDRAHQNGFACEMESGKCYFKSPKGPVLLVSQPATKGLMRWKLRCDGNSSFVVALIPEAQVQNPKYLFSEAKVGFMSTGTSRPCKLMKIDCYQRWMEIVVDVDNETIQYVVEEDDDDDEGSIPRNQKFSG
eukprot:CAMPEP_0184319864 /NCGR_PEP_ID=MMETSP1049-20130417/111030_1 /TAXON_ID=77928 /ORGANISM="Proteomonas sulcata, Strain CCMP704" /LENGTH=130 /DNA_ID=CAMNT_0026640181 /DNA_START=1 /DNA_END=390 /DNA_ORIENTATION=+